MKRQLQNISSSFTDPCQAPTSIFWIPISPSTELLETALCSKKTQSFPEFLTSSTERIIGILWIASWFLWECFVFIVLTMCNGCTECWYSYEKPKSAYPVVKISARGTVYSKYRTINKFRCAPIVCFTRNIRSKVSRTRVSRFTKISSSGTREWSEARDSYC